MRGLKYIAIFMGILLVISLLLVWYFFATASVSIAAYGAKGTPCVQNRETFEKIKTAMEEETFIGTRFSFEPIGEAEDYALITYTVRLSNQCLVPIDMIEIQIVPEPTDVAQMGNTTVQSLAAKTQGEFSATILVPKDSHSVRQIIVTYYVWGVGFDVRATYKDR